MTLARIRRTPAWDPTWNVSNAPLVYLDIETTGLHPDRGQQIVEVAVLTDASIRLHLRAHPDEGDRHLVAALVDDIDGLVVVGHNVSFDLRFISERAMRLNLEVPDVGYVDTLQLARRLDEATPGGLGLAAVARSLEIPVPPELHSAVPDARLTRDVFEHLRADHRLDTLEDAYVRRFRWRDC